jgi:hypothetical protein
MAAGYVDKNQYGQHCLSVGPWFRFLNENNGRCSLWCPEASLVVVKLGAIGAFEYRLVGANLHTTLVNDLVLRLVLDDFGNLVAL